MVVVHFLAWSAAMKEDTRCYVVFSSPLWNDPTILLKIQKSPARGYYPTSSEEALLKSLQENWFEKRKIWVELPWKAAERSPDVETLWWIRVAYWQKCQRAFSFMVAISLMLTGNQYLQFKFCILCVAICSLMSVSLSRAVFWGHFFPSQPSEKQNWLHTVSAHAGSWAGGTKPIQEPVWSHTQDSNKLVFCFIAPV